MRFLKRIYYIIEFLIFYLFTLVKSNLKIAADILTPKMKIKPGYVDVPLNFKTDTGLLLFSNLLSMTPGSLSYDISEKKDKISVHILYMKNEEEIQKELITIRDKIKRIAN